VDVSQQKTEYPLRLSVGQVARMVGFLVVMIAVCVFLALTNRKAIRLFGLVTLSPEEAVWMAWGGAAFFALAYMPFTLAIAWKGLFARQRVEFAEAGVWLPSSVWSSRHVLVPFADVRGVRVIARPRQRLLEVELPGRRFWIGETWLQSPSRLDEILGRLRSGMAAAAAAAAARVEPDTAPARAPGSNSE
jgi:hypothetical protein